MELKPYRAVGYRRVSAREQVEGHSLDAQEVHIRNFVESQGWHLLEIYTDAGISAKKGSRRPALEQLLRDAKEGKFEVVVVDKIDRFYRHLGSLLWALDQLNENGVSFASVQERLDFTTPWGKLMLTVLGMLAEIYLENLRQETKKGQRQRARKGLWLGGIPFGYCTGLCSDCEDPNGKDYCPEYGNKNIGDGKALIAHPIESEAVKLAFEWYITGEYSDRSIAERLNESYVTLSDGRQIPFRQKGRKNATKPGPFSRDIIRDMILRVAYTGKLPYVGMDSQGKHRHRKPPLEVLNGLHPVLVSEEVFEQAQKVREAITCHPLSKNNRPTRVYLLTGLLYCGYCGGHMRGESSMTKYYYGDGSRSDRLNHCIQSSVWAEGVEMEVVEFIQSVIASGKEETDFDFLDLQLREIEARFRRAQELFLSGRIKRNVYEEERIRMESAKKHLRLTGVGATMASLRIIHSGMAEWNELSPTEQKRLLRLSLEAAWVRESAVVAVKPSIAFLPLIGELSCNIGEGGIRTLG